MRPNAPLRMYKNTSCDLHSAISTSTNNNHQKLSPWSLQTRGGDGALVVGYLLSGSVDPTCIHRGYSTRYLLPHLYRNSSTLFTIKSYPLHRNDISPRFVYELILGGWKSIILQVKPFSALTTWSQILGYRHVAPLLHFTWWSHLCLLQPDTYTMFGAMVLLNKHVFKCGATIRRT